jgi:hypothetical protein
MALFVALVAGLLVVAESQASDNGFLSNSGYDKFVSPSLNHMKHGNGPAALSHHSNPAEHGPATVGTQYSDMPITMSAIGVGLLALVTMVGFQVRRRLQPATDMSINMASGLNENFMEMKSNAAASRAVGWGQLSSQNSRTPTLCYAEAAAPAATTAPPGGSAATNTALAGMVGGVMKGDPMPGEGAWDPLGLSNIHGMIQGSEHAGVFPSPQWMREAEIKHGRVAMLAFTGALFQEYGMHFDGTLAGQYYEKGVNAFEATPSAFATNPAGMAQILLAIGLTEGVTFPEGAWAGTMKREPGDLGYRVMRKNDVMEEQQIKELKNGRAAMLAIIAFSSAHYIPGSVPFFFNA